MKSLKKIIGLIMVGVMFATNVYAIDPPTVEPDCYKIIKPITKEM